MGFHICMADVDLANDEIKYAPASMRDSEHDRFLVMSLFQKVMRISLREILSHLSYKFYFYFYFYFYSW